MGQRQCCGAGVNHGTVMAVATREWVYRPIALRVPTRRAAST